MPMSERNGIIREFRAASRAVISNAKCLTEGVDVPAVDMVAFLTPKRSRVDIVQATGRAMRKSDGKTTGYILIPLFVEQAKGETIEQALARTEFDEVWNVLQAMQEQDEKLAEIIRQMREERGRTKGFDDTRFRKKVEFLGPQIALETLRASITTACVEVLAENWDERFGELKAFKEEFGHCNVTHLWLDNPTLGAWVGKQRARHARLSADRVAKLESIGFLWNFRDAKWEEMFSTLVTYERAHGTCNVPWQWPENPKLAGWVFNQRQNPKRLNPDRIRRLDEIGFVWVPLDAVWEAMFDALVEYRSTHGNCHVPVDYRENPQLGRWTRKQRAAKKLGRLTAERARRLHEIGFEWDPSDTAWEKMFAVLIAYKEVHGDCDVPTEWPANLQLSRWVFTQRRVKRMRGLNEDRIRRLDELSFDWNPVAGVWERMFAALLEYKRVHGDCDVPILWNENPQLGKWVSHQRSFHRTGKLSEERIRSLQAAGFVMDPFDSAWDEMFKALVEYKHSHGDCDVPAKWSGNRKLGAWVHGQRRRRNQGTLEEPRFARLDAIGFIWEVIDDSWDVMRHALCQYREKHGDCNITRGCPENRKLALWVSKQRQTRKSGRMSVERIRELDEMGFLWNFRDTKWNEMFAALRDFKQQHGHCNVPRGYSLNPQLGQWVKKQRSRHGTLSQKRIRKLDELGFSWKRRT